MADKNLNPSQQENQAPKKFLGIELTFKPTKRPQTKSLMQVGLAPVANFLPPFVNENKRAAFVRRRLFALSMVTISVSFLAFVGSTIVSFSGDMALRAAELRFTSVQAEQAKYSQVRDLEASIRFLEGSRYIATASQIDYQELITLLEKQLPSGAIYNSIQVSPLTGSDVASTGLTTPFAAQVSIAMQLKDYPSLQLYLNRLPTLDSFYDSKLASVSTTDDGITVSLVVYLNAILYERPFENPIILGEPVPPSIFETESRVSRADGKATESSSIAPSPSPSRSPQPAQSPTPKPTSSSSPEPTPSTSPTGEVTG